MLTRLSSKRYSGWHQAIRAGVFRWLTVSFVLLHSSISGAGEKENDKHFALPESRLDRAGEPRTAQKVKGSKKTEEALSSDPAPQPEDDEIIKIINNDLHFLHTLLKRNKIEVKDRVLHKRLLQGFLEASGFPDSDKYFAPFPATRQKPPDPVFGVSSVKNIKYIRLTWVAPKSLEKIHKTVSQPNSEEKIIIDLRGSGGYFEEFPETPFPEWPKNGLAPVILINHNTTGSAEILASFFNQQLKSPLLGSQSAGRPLPCISIELPSGQSIKLPQKKPEHPYIPWPPRPLKPLISTNDETAPPPPPDLKNFDWNSYLKKDRALEKAIDLIIAIQIYQIRKVPVEGNKEDENEKEKD